IFFVFFLGIGGVDTLQIGVIKIAALDPPDLVKHLRPLRARIHVYFEIGDAQRPPAPPFPSAGRPDHVLRDPWPPRPPPPRPSRPRPHPRPKRAFFRLRGKAQPPPPRRGSSRSSGFGGPPAGAPPPSGPPRPRRPDPPSKGGRRPRRDPPLATDSCAPGEAA